MRIDKSQISGTRLMFTVACFIQSSALLTAFLSSITVQDSWLAVIFGFIICLPFIWLYRTLMLLFPDKNLIQVLEAVYGRIAGDIIGVLYVLFFITLAGLNAADLSNFAKLTIMDETPSLVLLLMCILVGVVTRYSPLFVVVSSVILVVSCLLLFNQIDLENFLPIFDQPVIKYVQGAHIVSTIPFGELVALLMLTPNIKLSRRNTAKHLFGGLAIGAVTLMLAKMRDIAVLGNMFPMFTLPSLVSLRLVHLGESLSRMEILFAIALIMLLFFKVIILYYVTVIAVAQLLKVKSYRHIVLAAGALIVAYGLTLNPCPVQIAASARESIPFVWAVLEFLIPVLTLVIAKLRKLPKTKEV